MAYKQKHKYGFRDSLPKGDPEKVIYGDYFDDEFEAIEKAISDIGSGSGSENRPDGPDGGAGFDEPTADGKPYSRQVEGGQTVGAWVEAPTTDDIEYLDGRIDAIEGNISGGGGFVEAPDDGSDYARNGKSPAWVKTYNAEYIDEIEGNKADKDHTHTTDEITGLDDKIDEIEGDITDLEGAVGALSGQLAMGGSYDASTGLVVKANLSGFTAGQPLPDYSTVPNTFVIVTVAGNNPEELDEADWLVAGQSGWVPIKYGTAGTVDWDNISNVPDFGAGMVIQPDEPADPTTGLQWLESTTGKVWIWDEDKWLEFPAGGSGGGASYDDTGIRDDLATETQDRIDGDAALQTQIDGLSAAGGGGAWEHIDTISGDNVAAAECLIPEGVYDSVRLTITARGGASAASAVRLQLRRQGSYIVGTSPPDYITYSVTTSGSDLSGFSANAKPYFDLSTGNVDRLFTTVVHLSPFSNAKSLQQGVGAHWSAYRISGNGTTRTGQFVNGAGACHADGWMDGVKVTTSNTTTFDVVMVVEGIRK